MAINVNELELPFVDTKFIPNGKDTYALLQHTREVAEQSWIAKTAFGFALLRHKDIEAILKDKRWHNALTLIVKANPFTTEEFKKRRVLSIICLEDEDHSRIKKLIQPAFNPASVNKLRPYMRQYMNEIIDDIYSRGECDLQTEVFDKYPVNMICKILGVPNDDWVLFNEWANKTFKNFGIQFSEATDTILKTQKAFEDYSTNIIEYKRNNLGDDLLSDLIRAEVSGDKLTFEELKMIVEVIIVAGIDTTRSQLGITTLMISENPELWNKIATDDTARDRIIEESIRLDGVLKNVGRFASEDIEYNGVLFPQGTGLNLPISAANFDPDVYANPDDFNYERPNLIKDTLGYGGGVHYCLGTALARAELQEALSVLASRIPNFKIQEGVVYKESSETVWGVRSLPITF